MATHSRSAAGTDFRVLWASEGMERPTATIRLASVDNAYSGSVVGSQPVRDFELRHDPSFVQRADLSRIRRDLFGRARFGSPLRGAIAGQRRQSAHRTGKG